MYRNILPSLMLGGLLLASSPMDNGPVIVDGNYDMLSNHDSMCADLKQQMKGCSNILENCKKWARSTTEFTWCYNSDRRACDEFEADFAINCDK